MSRLLFAAARGARVLWMYDQTCGPDTFSVVQKMPECYLIHPEDEALQYGPVSTALREFAISGVAWPVETEMKLLARYYFCEVAYEGVPYDADHRSLFLLILAEALADEGL